MHVRILLGVFMQERRRGTELEQAILDAAWVEIRDNGYAGLTMERTAARAGTSRPVLSRRWSSVQQLATAAIQRELERRPLVVPDLDNLRGELLLFLHQASQRADVFAAGIALFVDEFQRGFLSSPQEFRATVLTGEEDVLETIITRGVVRGEIDADKVEPPVASLLSDLFRNHVMMTMEQPPVEMQRAWIDRIFLPLVQSDSHHGWPQ